MARKYSRPLRDKRLAYDGQTSARKMTEKPPNRGGYRPIPLPNFQMEQFEPQIYQPKSPDRKISLVSVTKRPLPYALISTKHMQILRLLLRTSCANARHSASVNTVAHVIYTALSPSARPTLNFMNNPPAHTRGWAAWHSGKAQMARSRPSENASCYREHPSGRLVLVVRA